MRRRWLVALLAGIVVMIGIPPYLRTQSLESALQTTLVPLVFGAALLSLAWRQKEPKVGEFVSTISLMLAAATYWANGRAHATPDRKEADPPAVTESRPFVVPPEPDPALRLALVDTPVVPERSAPNEADTGSSRQVPPGNSGESREIVTDTDRTAESPASPERHRPLPGRPAPALEASEPDEARDEPPVDPAGTLPPEPVPVLRDEAYARLLNVYRTAQVRARIQAQGENWADADRLIQEAIYEVSKAERSDPRINGLALRLAGCRKQIQRRVNDGLLVSGCS